MCNNFTLIVIGVEVGNTMCDGKEKHDQTAAWSNTLSLAVALMLLPMFILTEDAQSFFRLPCMFLSVLIL